MKILGKYSNFLFVALFLMVNISLNSDASGACCYEEDTNLSLTESHSSKNQEDANKACPSTDGHNHFCHSNHCFAALPVDVVRFDLSLLKLKEKFYRHNELYKSLDSFDFFRPPIA